MLSVVVCLLHAAASEVLLEKDALAMSEEKD